MRRSRIGVRQTGHGPPRFVMASAQAALETVDDELTRGVLEIHAERASTGKRELHLLQRFTAPYAARRLRRCWLSHPGDGSRGGGSVAELRGQRREAAGWGRRGGRGGVFGR